MPRASRAGAALGPQDGLRAQAANESLITAALSKDERRRLNALLRRLMREFERREADRS